MTSENDIPNAELYTTIVARHEDKNAAKSFIATAHANWPFRASEAETLMAFVSVGDSASVMDAMRMALTCRELGNDERVELALALEAHCFTWAECLAYAEAEWELAEADGEFVGAQAGDARRAETRRGSVHEHAVAEGDAPNSDRTTP